MTKTFTVDEISSLDPVIEELTSLMNRLSIFLMRGDLGAGKTTLVKRWMNSLGCEDLVTSPTFSIVNEYVVDKEIFYHMDLYRMNDYMEVVNVGIIEILETPDGKKIIEWPELVEQTIDDPYAIITIETTPPNRIIRIDVRGLSKK